MELTKVLDAMQKAAKEAGSVLLDMQSKTRELKTKKDFLTDADLKSEEIILKILEDAFPGIPSFSEEKGGDALKEGFLWVIDPIDGTINFFLGDDHWGVSIALVENGKTIAGVVYLPAKKKMFSASKDSVSVLKRTDASNFIEKIPFITNESDISRSQFWISWGKEEHGGEDHEKVYRLIKALDTHSLYPQIRNSATADMMMFVEGKIGGYVFPKPEPFDVAAAGFIIQRAHGVVTDINGNEWNPFSESILASNKAMHSGLLKIVREIL